MKVKELIAVLKEFDPDQDVIGVYVGNDKIPQVEEVDFVSDNNQHAQLNLTSATNFYFEDED